MQVSQTSEHVFLDPFAEAKRGEEAEHGMPERLQWGNDAAAVLPCCCCQLEDLDEPIAGRPEHVLDMRCPEVRAEVAAAEAPAAAVGGPVP